MVQMDLCLSVSVMKTEVSVHYNVYLVLYRALGNFFSCSVCIMYSKMAMS